MYESRRKINFESDIIHNGSEDVSKERFRLTVSYLSKQCLKSYLVFVFYCTLLMVPLYAITMSVIKHDWIMVIIDALIVPIGFVHGILLLTGLLS
jgi:hypothetical protein